MSAHAHNSRKPSSFEVRVLRQDRPGQPGRWERHRVTYEPNLNVISVLQKIAARPPRHDGKADDARRLGLQLPGRGLRRLHDAGQRRDPAGVLGAGRSSARGQPDEASSCGR